MPENKPPFDPNKPVNTGTNKPAFNPNEPVKAVADTRSSGTDYSFLNGIRSEAEADEIIDRLDTKNDDEKQIIKNIAIAQKQGRASVEDISDAILTIQGQHPKQSGGTKYYMKDVNGVQKPVPIANNERPPEGYDVASIWGSQESANDDGFIKSAAKHLVNGVIGAAEGVANLPQIAYGAITGEELPWYQTMKNSADYLKFKTPEYENEQIFDTKELKGISDFFDPSRYDFTKNNIQGAVLQGMESITSFLVGAKGIGGATRTLGAGAEGAGLISEGGKAASFLSGASNSGKLANGFAGSYMVNYDEALTAAEQAGLEGRDKYAFASVATIPTALLEMVGGTEGIFIKNQLARNGKKEMFNSLAAGLLKDSEGKITKESLEGLYNATTTAATKLNSTFAGQLAGNIAGEAGTEAAQSFALNAAKNIYDKISGEEKFKTDPFSLESFGEYVNSALAGALGAGGPALAGVSQKRKADRAEKQSNNAYETVKKGTEAITALKADIDNSVANDEMTPEDAERAKFKLDAYNVYHDQTKGLDLTDEERKKSFDLSFTIEGIKSEIPTDESEIKKMSPIEAAKVAGKKELVKGLQKELDAIILKENVKKETTVAPDTVGKVVKNEEKKAEESTIEDLGKRYGGTKTTTEEVETPTETVVEKSERRKNAPKFGQKDDNGTFEFNKQKPLERKEILHDYFDANPDLNGEMDAFIEGGQNEVWQLNLGGTGQFVQFGRSVKRDEYTGERENFPSGEETTTDSDGREYSKFKEPVTVKIQTIKADKVDANGKPRKTENLRILNVYNKSTGKYIVSVKEKEKGNSAYTPDEIKRMVALQQQGLKPIEGVKQPEKPQVKVEPVKAPVVKPEPVKERPTTTKVEEKVRKAPATVTVNELERESLIGEGYDNSSINKAIRRSNDLLKMPAQDLYKELRKLGVFNIGIQGNQEFRPDVGLDAREYAATLKQIEKGKDSKTLQKLLDFVEDVKETGNIKFLSGTGGTSERYTMPLYQSLLENVNPDRGLTEEEENAELEKEQAREQAFSETGQFQKSSDRKGQIQKVVERVRKSFPKVKVVYKEGAKFAGRLIGNTIEINPDYAGIDTPIHEAGHIMIDAIGYNNKVIQVGIKQLKDTPLWDDVKERYPELNEEMLGKEVLAEAIGMEGSLIFDKESVRNKFEAVLSYIFNRLKQLLGIDKNVAKSLAKQIIGGVNTRNKVGESKQEQLSKKKPFKTLDEMSAKDLAKKLTMSLESYRENVLGRSLEQIRKDLQFIKDALADEKYTEEQKEKLKVFKANIDKEAKRDASKWFAYKEDVDMLSSILSEGRLEDMTDERLLEAYNLMVSGDFADAAKEPKLNQLKQQIGYRMFVKRKTELEGLKGYVEEQANKTDLSAKDVLMKNLGHMTQNQPELQSFSKQFDETYFDMQQERDKLKGELENIGKEVIKEKNKSLGITDKAKEFVMSGSVKYFEFVEHPDGRYYTLEEAKAKSFTPAQTKFLKFMLGLNDLRNKQFEGMDEDQLNNEVLKVDKGVAESFREEGILQAFSAYLGNGHNIQNVRIKYGNKVMSYGEIERDLIKQGNKGALDKMKALLQMVKYQLAARRQLKTGTNVDEKENPLALTGGAEYNLSTDGRLKSKFNKPRDKSRGYSKDFYKAAHSFIDDYTHTEHIGKLLPYIQSIEYLNQVGFKEHEKKENVAEWVKQWTDLHIFKKEKVGALGPELDTFFRIIRKLTSLNVMAFAYRAGGFNIAMGIYNTIRKESAEAQYKGTKRLIQNPKKAAAIIRKYNAVSLDFDSNPKLYAGKLFEMLAHGLTRGGEYYIQGSAFLGLMSDKDFNSIEYNESTGQVKLKEGADEKGIKSRAIANIKTVSDIQGKYGEADKRNYQAGEFGKLVGQFKIWVPDAFKQRMGEEYIDANGVTHRGTYRAFLGQGFTDLKEAIKKDGIEGFTKNKDAMSNLKGLMVVAAFMALRLGGDDDKNKRKKGDAIDQALSNLLFIFDIDNIKFFVKSPVAAQATVSKFVNVMEDVMKLDVEKGSKDIISALPNSKAIKAGIEFIEED